MTIDFAPVVQALIAATCAAIPAAAAYVAPAVKKYLHVSMTSQQSAAVQSAADAGAKLAYSFLVTNAGKITDVNVRNVAIADGVNHVLASVPDALKTLGVTPDHVSAMVSARLGGLLATDPTVTVMPPPAAPSAPQGA